MQPCRQGMTALRHALHLASGLPATVAVGAVRPGPGPGAGHRDGSALDRWLLSGATTGGGPGNGSAGTSGKTAAGAGQAISTAADEAERERLIALVDLARGGDREAFAQLYDHYQVSIYRFIYYKVGSVPLAEDLCSETFFRALRKMNDFQWQGKDFGAWLVTIARNLTTDHFKSGRTRLEHATDHAQALDGITESPEQEVLEGLTNKTLLAAVRELPPDQQDCLVMRFLQDRSIAETATVMGRSSGAVKQLQLRAVRNLARLLPEGIRG